MTTISLHTASSAFERTVVRPVPLYVSAISGGPFDHADHHDIQIKGMRANAALLFMLHLGFAISDRAPVTSLAPIIRT